jgi:PIN domain nuclease of toxin-antitoxin system
MNLLLDTHTLLWILTDNKNLSKKVRRLFLSEDNEIYLSVASIWEMAIKVSIGRLNLSEPVKEFVQNQVKGNDIKILAVEAEDIYPIETLPFHHRDPFDRLIIAQSMTRNYPILSADVEFDAYPIKRIW